MSKAHRHARTGRLANAASDGAFDRALDRGPVHEVFEQITLADLDLARPAAIVEKLGEPDRFTAAAADASNVDAIEALIREARADAVLNSVDPRFNKPIFDAALRARVTYLDMATTFSEPHPERPYGEVGIKLGDYQFERARAWSDSGVLALADIDIEPGAADVFARYAADHLFSEIDEVSVPP